MAFAFNNVCVLLEKIENKSIRSPRLSVEERKSDIEEIIRQWFTEHRQAIYNPGTNGGAILSAIFPHRRKDRVYGLGPRLLSQKLTRILNFNHGQKALFEKWRTGTNGDLGVHTANAMKPWDGTIRKKCSIPINRVDRLLVQLAAQNRFSDPAIRKQRDWHMNTDSELKGILIRLDSGEAKWLVRLMLREYCTIDLNEKFVFEQFHFLLPAILLFQNDFGVAYSLLTGELSCFPPAPRPEFQTSMRIEAARKLAPTIGVKVGRPTFYKAWSFKHCFQLVGNRSWAAEIKYDGEYCEIHANLENSPRNIQIFSKNGKDATKDRRALHSTIQESLRIGQSDCRFKRRCIVLGELVLYSDKEKRILPFSKIRKHVSRSGSYLGTLQDSLPHEWEHLMIVFFDILVLDDVSILRQSLQERRRVLKDVVQMVPGRAMRSEWTLVDFKTEDGITDLKQAFARTLANRQEGLILKPLHAPYFPLFSDQEHHQKGYFIKLKKDYLADMGGGRDLGDFAIVGASYDAQAATKTDLSPLHWTHFHLGCLTNKSAVERTGAKPKFKIVGALGLYKCISKGDLKYLNDNGMVRRAADGLVDEFDFEQTCGFGHLMTVTFKKPFVAEILGSGYEQMQNETFEMLRHPRIKKLHHDRTWEDTVTMEHLEQMARQKWEAPDSDELNGHAKDVAILAKRYTKELRLAQATTTTTTTTTTTSSEYETTQETSQRTAPRSTQQSTPSPHATPDKATVQETPEMASPGTWTTPPSIRILESPSATNFKDSKKVRILVREDTNDKIAPSPLPIPPNAAATTKLPTHPVLSRNSSSSSSVSKRRRSMMDLAISPPALKKRQVRTPLEDSGMSRNLGACGIDSQEEKIIHNHAEEGWKVKVHSPSEMG